MSDDSAILESEKPGGDRRPLKSRSWTVFQRIATALVRMDASPNAISVAGMLCGIWAGLVFGLTPWVFQNWGSGAVRCSWIICALLMQGRLLANLFDGMVAIESGKASAIGELYNEIPDRVSDCAILIGAGYAVGGNVAAGYAAAIFAVMTAYVRAIGKAATGKSDYGGPMAKQQRMAVLTGWCVTATLIPSAWWTATWGTFPLYPLGYLLVFIAAASVWTTVRRLRRVAVAMHGKSGLSLL